MQRAIRETANLIVVEGEVDDLLGEGQGQGQVTGVCLAGGREIRAAAVVLTTGTFLRGLIHIGEGQIPAGRIGEAPAVGLSRTLESAGFVLGRLKTGTPPRLDGDTIDWPALQLQPGDEPPEPFSALTERIANPQNSMRDYAHDRSHPRDHPRQRASLAHVFGPDQEPRPALLSFHRRQDRALRRARRASDFPRARRPR